MSLIADTKVPAVKPAPMTVEAMHEFLTKLAWKLDGKYMHELTQAAEMIQSMENIPKDVFYDQDDYFYILKGMHGFALDADGYRVKVTDAFYYRWKMRCKEFPTQDKITRVKL